MPFLLGRGETGDLYGTVPSLHSPMSMCAAFAVVGDLIEQGRLPESAIELLHATCHELVMKYIGAVSFLWESATMRMQIV